MSTDHHQWNLSSDQDLNHNLLSLKDLELLSPNQVEVEEDTLIQIQMILLLGSGNLSQVVKDLVWINLLKKIYRRARRGLPHPIHSPLHQFLLLGQSPWPVC